MMPRHAPVYDGDLEPGAPWRRELTNLEGVYR